MSEKHPCKHQDCNTYPKCAGCTEMDGFWEMVKEVMKEREKEGKPANSLVFLVKEK
jgi:hypothetical protein